MPSIEFPLDLSTTVRRELLTLARASIDHGLRTGTPLPVDPAPMPAALRERASSFVTLYHQDQLRGCIGSLEATAPLAVDVAEHSFAAAFRDPRFPPLRAEEAEGLTLSIAVIGPQEPLYFSDETDLLAQLRPGLDGLIIASGHRRATFLPSVWAQLPEPADFLAHLKRKAGLDEQRPAPDLRAWRYQTLSFH